MGIYESLEGALSDDLKFTQGIDVQINKIFYDMAASGNWSDQEFKIGSDDKKSLYNSIIGEMEKYLEKRGIGSDVIKGNDRANVFMGYFGLTPEDVQSRIEKMDRVDAQAISSNIIQPIQQTFFIPKVNAYLGTQVNDGNYGDAKNDLLNTYSAKGLDAPDDSQMANADKIRKKFSDIYIGNALGGAKYGQLNREVQSR